MKIREIINKEITAIQNLERLNNDFETIIEVIYTQIAEKKGKVVFSGVGKSGEMSKSISSVFNSILIPSVFIHPLEALHGDSGVVGENDILFVISNSGETEEILNFISAIKDIYKHIKLISVTSDEKSTVAKKSDYKIVTGIVEEVHQVIPSPTLSITIVSVIKDILVFLLMERTKLSKEDYAKRHKGGTLI